MTDYKDYEKEVVARLGDNQREEAEAVRLEMLPKVAASMGWTEQELVRQTASGFLMKVIDDYQLAHTVLGYGDDLLANLMLTTDGSPAQGELVTEMANHLTRMLAIEAKHIALINDEIAADLDAELNEITGA